jgi:uncharacterized protein
VTVTQDLLAFLVMAVGAALQGILGFGANLLAVPLLLLIAPALVPTPVIAASLLLNLLMTWREKGVQHWRAMRWPLFGLLPGSVTGAIAVAVASKQGLTVFFGVLVLVAVGLSASGLHPRRTRINLGLAGALSGFMGTAVGIGGPPIALVFQRSSGSELRGVLSRFFLVSSAVSLALLAAVGQVSVDDARRALTLMGGVVVGYAASGHLTHRVADRHIRGGILILSALSALIGIARVVA